jgi:hypothetical protein
MKFLAIFLSAAGLFATVNEPLRWEILSGYRNDRTHWHLQDPGEGAAITYSELYRDIEYWENGLVLKVIHRDLTFFLRGAYGTFGRGTAYQRYPEIQTRTHTSTTGWTADGSGYFGYAVNLTADRTYKVILTPLIGYCGYFEQLKKKDTPGNFRLVWNGFLFGGGIAVEPGGNLIFNVGYSYHLMHNQVRTAAENMGGAPARQSIKTSSGGNSGQSGWAQMDWLLGYYWRLGIGGQIHYFSTRVVDATVGQAGRGDFSQKFKLRWTPVSAWAQISRTF